MPLSTEQEKNISPGHSPQQPVNISQRESSLSGLQFLNKESWKNGTTQDHGGAAAWTSVTSSKTQNKISYQSPELKIKMKASPDLYSATSHADFASSPIELPHLGETDGWAENFQTHPTSHDNLLSLADSSTDPPLKDKLGKFHWTKEQRDIPNGYPPLVLLPKIRRRPLSYQLDGSYLDETENHQSEASSSTTRRKSMYSQTRHASHPSLLHQTPAQFYAPDASLMSPKKSGLFPGESGYHCGFDTLLKENVVVTGYNGGVGIYAISKRGLTKISGIDSLRGGVQSAKILPWTINESNSGIFPLIALVIYGPFREMDKVSDSMLQYEEITINCSSNTRGREKNSDEVDCYQTTVELYSLSGAKQHVATLLSLPKTHSTIPFTNPPFRAPPPVGALSIRADSGNLIITSGTTGETWIFRQSSYDGTSRQYLRCIGKVWTTVQHSMTVEAMSPKGFDDWQDKESQPLQKQCNAPILSVNGRWLAYCPATPSSQTSLGAVVPGLNSAAKIPGLNTYAPPQLPGINCGVETPGGESMMKHIVQMGTQKFIKASNYLAQQGMQVWTNYRNKPATNSQLANGSLMYQAPENMTHKFPPTHGPSTPAPFVTKDPGLISILDLDALGEQVSSTGSSSVCPLSTFRVPHGCSFLSFSPNGLFLFTASSKGDLQFVWDLMQIKYAKTSLVASENSGSGPQGPHVRQIAEFFRMTIARIVDLAWTSPHGDRAAMVTEPGTIHILDLPASAFTWPPLRRKTPIQESEDNTIGNSGSIITATGVATSAVNSFWTAARPLVSRRRRSSACLSARAVTSQAGHGTQALAAGISRSVGAATGKMNEIRKSGSTKLHLPRNATAPERPCVLLLNKNQDDLVIALAGGIVRLYTIKSRRADRPADKQKASVKMSVEYRIPTLPDNNFASDTAHDMSSEFADRRIKEIFRRTTYLAPRRRSENYAESSIPQAEIESNTPYQPFHTGRGVGLHTYCILEAPSSSTFVSDETTIMIDRKCRIDSTPNDTWVFGDTISTVKLDVGFQCSYEDHLEDLIESHTLPSSEIESVMKVSDSAEESEQIVITTRRRKVSRPGTSGTTCEYGFFEDGCEVLDFTSQRR